MRIIIAYIKSWLLFDIARGLAKTLRYFFKKKVTINYPFERNG